MRENTFIAKVGAAFVRRYRITILLLIAILGLGFFAYNNVLARDGFPSIEFPLSTVQVTYFANDPVVFDDQIIGPIEESLRSEEIIKSIGSSTDGNFGNLVIQYETDVTSEEGNKLVKEVVESEVELPEGAQIRFQSINVASVDGVSDLVFSLYAKDMTEEEIQSAANLLAGQLEDVSGIEKVNVNEFTVERFDPQTGQSFPSRENYTKIGIKNGEEEISYYPAINLGVIGDKELSTMELSELVQTEVGKIMEGDQYDDLKVEYIGDLGETVTKQIASLEVNFLTGLIAVALVLILFVNWRASLVAVIFIPTVLAATFITMAAFDLTLNVISLFALVLALGLLVDDAIVVIEAIDRNKREGHKGVDAITKSLNEIGMADVLGTLTTVLVFAPMLFISGVLGDFIKELPQTIIIALFLSLIIALTIVPVLSDWLIRYSKNGRKSIFQKINYFLDTPSRYMYKVGEYAGRYVKYTLNNKIAGAIVFTLSMLLIIAGFAVAGILFSERFNPFPPVKDADVVAISGNFNQGITIDEAEDVSNQVNDLLASEYPEEVVRVDYFMGNQFMLYINMNLTDLNERDITAVEMAEMFNEEVSGIEKADVKFSVQGAGPPESDFPLAIQVYAEDQETLGKLSSDIATFIEGVEIDGEGATDIVVENLENISRKDGLRFAEVKAKLTDPTNTQLVLQIQDQVKEEFTEEVLADEYGVTIDAIGYDLGQQSENLDSFESLGLVLIAALVLMYVLLVWQFDSFTQPLLIIFLALFLALPGAFFGLYLTDNYMSFLTAIGLIGLIGIVVNNTIMLVDFANQYQRDGNTAREAITEAVSVRFRPLVTTTVTTIVGLLPLALTDPFWEPISFTIIFGLITSTTLVILAFPIYYNMLEWSRNGVKGFARKLF